MRNKFSNLTLDYFSLVGNPNSGKSTLVNRIIDEAGVGASGVGRSLTSPIAGTTHGACGVGCFVRN